MWWVEVHKKESVFFVTLILSEGNFFNICILSQCIVYWINFQKIHILTYQKKHYFMLLHIQTKHYVIQFIIIIIIIIILFQCFTWRYRYGIRFYFRVFYRFTNFPFTCRDRYWFIAKRLLPFSYLGAVP